MPDNHRACAHCFAIDLHGFSANERRGNGNRGRDDGVNAAKRFFQFGEQALAIETSYDRDATDRQCPNP